MKKKIVCMLVCILFFSTTIESITSTKESTEIPIIIDSNVDYSHTVFVEVASSQTCKPCNNWSQEIYNTYTSGNYGFEYVEMIIFDHDGYILNEDANNWKQNYWKRNSR